MSQDLGAIDIATSLETPLAGRYEIVRELGHGGMARVFLARDIRHDREVALKVLRPEIAMATGRERFLREIQVEGALQHPQILPLFDSGSAGGLLYYVMPYVPGESLRQRLAREKQLPVDEGVRIGLEVADALDYAHRQGIVHRDIKPENILLSQGHAMVADFGLAHAISAAGSESLTGSGTSVGTPAYMSPEQAGGVDEVDGRSDIYSLGCVVYEMLAGEPPFTGRTPQAILARQMQERPPSLRIVRPTISTRLLEVVETALAKVPADRYHSAADFGAALASARRRHLLPRPSLRLLRGKAGWAVAGMAGAALAIGGRALVMPAGSASLDPNRVLVFPFSDASAAGTERGIGADVATYVGHMLDGSEPLRWDEASAIDSAPAEFTRRRRARHYVDGVIVRSPDSVTVIARLHDAGGDSLLGRAGRSDRAGASEARLGALAVADLLPLLLAPERRVDVGALTNRQPAAIASFLLGERAYRMTHFREALEHYHRALGHDSLFALAAVKGSTAASWLDLPEEAERLAGLAERGESRLPTRQVEFVRGLRRYVEGAADSAVAHLRRALAIAPEWQEAWMALGEVYYHLLPRAASPDSLATDAFARSLRIDSAFTPPLYHLAEIAIRDKDLDGAERLIRRLQRVDPDTSLSLQLDLMVRCARRGPKAVDWSTAARAGYHEVLDVGAALARSPPYAACAKAALGAVFAWDSTDDSHRFGALFALQNLLLLERRFDEARDLLKSEAGRKYGGEFFFLLDAAAIGGFDQEADDVARSQGTDYGAMTTRRLWILGLSAAKRGRAVDASRIGETLRAKADSSDDPRDRLFADIVAAHAALAAGDSAGALTRLQALTPSARRNEIAWSLWEPLGPERQALAELLLARGQFRAAIDVASGFDAPGPVAYLLYLRNSLAVRARAADAMRDGDAARRYGARLAALSRADADASIRRANP